MRVITHTCLACGTIVSANEIESNRVMKCPDLGCENVIRFDDLRDEAQEYFLENKQRYGI